MALSKSSLTHFHASLMQSSRISRSLFFSIIITILLGAFYINFSRLHHYQSRSRCGSPCPSRYSSCRRVCTSFNPSCAAPRAPPARCGGARFRARASAFAREPSPRHVLHVASRSAPGGRGSPGTSPARGRTSATPTSEASCKTYKSKRR